MPFRIPEAISRREERRFERPVVREDMVVVGYRGRMMCAV